MFWQCWGSGAFSQQRKLLYTAEYRPTTSLHHKVNTGSFCGHKDDTTTIRGFEEATTKNWHVIVVNCRIVLVTTALARLRKNSYSYRYETFTSSGTGTDPLNSPDGSTQQCGTQRNLLCLSALVTFVIGKRPSCQIRTHYIH